jgi:CSLREA domain-containing protein
MKLKKLSQIRYSLLMLLLFFIIVKSASSQYNFNVITTTENEAPGTGGLNFRDFHSDRTFLSNSGTVVFSAYYQDLQTKGLWKYNNNELKKIVTRGDLNIEDFDFKYGINDFFALSATLAGPNIDAFNNSALYFGTNLKLVAQSGDFVQTLNGFDLFMSLGGVQNYNTWVGNDSAFLFHSTLRTEDGTVATDYDIIWKAGTDENDLIKFAQESVSPLPGFEDFTNQGMYPYVVNSGGTVVYQAYGTETGGNADELIRALYRKEKNQEAEPVVYDRILAGDEFSLDVRELTINSDGLIAFSGSNESRNNFGIWLENNDSFKKIVSLDDPAPDSGGNTFSELTGFALDDSSRLFLLAKTTGNQTGIWIYNNNSFQKIVTSGDDAPGTNTTFMTINNLVINRKGELAFVGQLNNLPNYFGIWTGTPESFEFLIGTGSNLTVKGSQETIENIYTPHSSTFFVDPGVTGSGADGFPTYFNENGDIVFMVDYGDPFNPDRAVIYATKSIVVNTTEDKDDLDPGDGICDCGGPDIDGRRPCSLRAAIQEANADEDKTEITFNIPESDEGFDAENGIFTIGLPELLPEIKYPVSIDGTTQPGFDVEPLIVLDGQREIPAGEAFGIKIYGGNSEISGLVINNFFDGGIKISGNGNNSIQGNYIGTDHTGRNKHNGENIFKQGNTGNGTWGILIENSSNNIIGGTIKVEWNTISNNGWSSLMVPGFQHEGAGIEITTSGEGPESMNNKIYGNYIGTDPFGKLERGNLVGIKIKEASKNEIGGMDSHSINVISSNKWGIIIEKGYQNKIRSNIIGLQETGKKALPNAMGGIYIEHSYGTLIGGTPNTPGFPPGNVISGNKNENNEAFGIFLNFTDSVQIRGNIIGLDRTGELAIGNNEGILIDFGNNSVIGGTDTKSGNVISGNDNSGILILSSGSNIIRSNFIGTNMDGLSALENGKNGIEIYDYSTTVIHSNLISGNHENGLMYRDIPGNDDNVLENNIIGADVTGENPLSNGKSGVYLENASGVLIGDSAGTSTNIIAFNQQNGIRIISGNQNPIRNNRIFSNMFLGIDLGENQGVSPNDETDADEGANQLQNFPILQRAAIDTLNNTISVYGYIQSKPNSQLTIDYFTNELADLFSGYGEGEFVTGSQSVTTGSNGIAVLNFQYPVSGTVPNNYVSATATDSEGNTSEFSQSVPVDTLAPSPFIVNSTGDNEDINPGDGICDTGGPDVEGKPECTLRAAIQEANALAGKNHIVFDIPDSAPYIISPETALPEITDPLVIDGTTEPDYIDFPVVEINGNMSESGDGLYLTAGNSKVKGLIINQFKNNGIVMAENNNNLVTGNYIGNRPDDADGSTKSSAAGDYGNAESGILIDGSSGNTIGGVAFGQPNVIEYNGLHGINILSGSGNEISKNSIFENGALGINLTGGTENESFVTENDENDMDNGANNLQNYPSIEAVSIVTDGVQVKGSLNSQPNSVYKINLFANSNPDISEFGEGEVFVGAIMVSTDESGYAEFETVFPFSGDETYFCATATDQFHNTSEFSMNRTTTPTGILRFSADVSPAGFSLMQNYPNPFRTLTNIQYSLPEKSRVSMAVYSVDGRKITELVNETNPAGSHKIKWNASGLNPGIYFFRIQAEPLSGGKNFNSIKKMIMLNQVN